VAWDGTGYGTDGSVWGGEFLRVGDRGWERVAHLRTFPLPGGDAAVKEPRRSALGVLYETFGDPIFACEDIALLRAFADEERAVLRQALSKGINCPRTSSAGRLFDAVAGMIGLRQRRQFEGQAAMELEWAIGDTVTDEAYPFGLSEHGAPLRLDWEPLVRAILAERSTARGTIAAKFHNTLVEMILAVAHRLGERRIVLSGGCFQNRYLTERTVGRLRAAGFFPYWHQRVPPNDGGIALGQLVATATWSTTDVSSHPR
jgi:hydrogenase maturation protein HypF